MTTTSSSRPSSSGRRRSRAPRPEGTTTAAPRTADRPAALVDAAPAVAEQTGLAEQTGFADLGVPAPLVAVLDRQGIRSAFPIQAATLPDSLRGRDVLGRGRTGSGKTLAFSLPLVAALVADGTTTRRSRPRALVLLPTRELATQVHATIEPLAAAVGLTATTVFGGVAQSRQVRALERGTDIVVACPGRLEDLMRQGHVKLDDVRVAVLDEADHMADLGFLPGVKRILDATPEGGQRLLFSATLDNGVDVLVRRYLDRPVTHSVDERGEAQPDIDHHVLTTSQGDKARVVRELASGEGRSVLFLRTKSSARRLARELTTAGIPAVDLHGNLAQNARDRNLAAFRDGEVKVLVATDIAARGIHVDDVALVVHVDPPAEHKAYTHRSGRTARAGASGVVVTIQTPAQKVDVDKLVRRAGISPTRTSVRPGDEALLALSGPRAELVEPVALPAPTPQRAPGARGQGRSRRAGSGSSSRSNASRPNGSGSGQPSGSRPSGRTGRSTGSSAASPERRMSAAEFSSGRRARGSR